MSRANRYETDVLLCKEELPHAKDSELGSFGKPVCMNSSALALFFVALIGWQNAMSNPQRDHNDEQVVHNTFPLKFTEHNFGAYCFNTITCKIAYAGLEDGEDGPSGAPAKGFLKSLYGGYVGIVNFPSPAVVTWQSLDGSTHEAIVDIGSIFKERLVLHHVPLEKIPTDGIAVAAPGPDIILVVNDRTISVYMKAMVFLKNYRVPSNPNSDYIDEPILAYTHTY